jgi:hypothetical protein
MDDEWSGFRVQSSGFRVQALSVWICGRDFKSRIVHWYSDTGKVRHGDAEKGKREDRKTRKRERLTRRRGDTETRRICVWLSVAASITCI